MSSIDDPNSKTDIGRWRDSEIITKSEQKPEKVN